MPQQTSGFVPIARGLYLEGLAFDAPRNAIWYSDVIAGGIHAVTPDGESVADFNPDRMWTGGILLNTDGAVLSSGAGGIRWNHPESEKSGWLVNTIDGAPINGINEMIPDGTGGIYFGTVDLEHIAKGEPTRPAALYRLTTVGEVKLVADDLGFTNGMMLSLDGKQFFYNDTFSGTYVFDVLADRSLANRRVLVEKDDCDGMALDAEGNLWITGFRSAAITRVRQDGSPLAAFETPGGAVTQIRFGGSDMRDIYITTVPADGGDGLKEGKLPGEKGSILYRGRSESAGCAIEATRFELGSGGQ